MARTTLLLLALGTTALLAGCSQFGPHTVQGGRADYAAVLNRTGDEQMLLNLVRLRYLERPYFLEVGSVTSQFTFSGRARTELAIDGLDVDDDLPLVLEGAYEESPTVSYVPLQGEDFVRRLLTPLPLEALVLLSQSGWSLERIMRLCVQRANEVGNATTASGPTPSGAPEFEAFLELARDARTLQQREQLTIAAEHSPERELAHLELSFVRGGEDTDEYRRITTLLGLVPDRTRYRLRESLRSGDGTAIDVQTRSLNGVLYYLSHGVDVPAGHLEAGVVRTTREAGGAPFDWERVTDGLIDIRSGRERPANADVAVRHRGHWFWIADDDLESKSTFSLLAQVVALQSGAASGARPVLTLPVGG